MGEVTETLSGSSKKVIYLPDSLFSLLERRGDLDLRGLRSTGGELAKGKEGGRDPLPPPFLLSHEELGKFYLHHLRDVLRIAPEEKLSLVSINPIGLPVKVATVFLKGNTLILESLEQLNAISSPKISCILPLIKGDYLSLAVEGLSQVGVRSILIFEADRSVKRVFPERFSKELKRLAKVVIGASSSARHLYLPTIAIFPSLDEVLERLKGADLILLDIKGSTYKELHLMMREIYLISGPEGGLSERELSLLEEANATKLSLGSQVLKAWLSPILGAYLLKTLL